MRESAPCLRREGTHGMGGGSELCTLRTGWMEAGFFVESSRQICSVGRMLPVYLIIRVKPFFPVGLGLQAVTGFAGSHTEVFHNLQLGGRWHRQSWWFYLTPSILGTKCALCDCGHQYMTIEGPGPSAGGSDNHKLLEGIPPCWLPPGTTGHENVRSR